jgi:hypothetical protein
MGNMVKMGKWGKWGKWEKCGKCGKCRKWGKWGKWEKWEKHAAYVCGGFLGIIVSAGLLSFLKGCLSLSAFYSCIVTPSKSTSQWP